MRPLLLAAHSNAGSTWLASCLIAGRGLVAHPEAKEFFNPVQNHAHYAALADLGCELYDCTANLVRPRSQAAIDGILAATWHREALTFTKENYLAFQLPRFLATFDVLVLVRAVAGVFPPERGRVMVWYDAWWCALRDHGWLQRRALRRWPVPVCATPEGRAVVGCALVQSLLLALARRYRLPVVWFGDLLEGDMDRLSALLDAPTAELVVRTRRRPPEPPAHHHAQWAAALAILPELASWVEEWAEWVLSKIAP